MLQALEQLGYEADASKIRAISEDDVTWQTHSQALVSVLDLGSIEGTLPWSKREVGKTTSRQANTQNGSFIRHNPYHAVHLSRIARLGIGK